MNKYIITNFLEKMLQEVNNQDISDEKLRKLEKFIICFEDENDDDSEYVENLFLGWYINKFLLKNGYNINE